MIMPVMGNRAWIGRGRAGIEQQHLAPWAGSRQAQEQGQAGEEDAKSRKSVQ